VTISSDPSDPRWPSSRRQKHEHRKTTGLIKHHQIFRGCWRFMHFIYYPGLLRHCAVKKGEELVPQRRAGMYLGARS
jgi:hypothetical protein